MNKFFEGSGQDEKLLGAKEAIGLLAKQQTEVNEDKKGDQVCFDEDFHASDRLTEELL